MRNNSQSQYSNISNIVQVGVYIYESESIAIRNGKIFRIQIGTQESDVYSKGNTAMLETWDRNRNKNRNRSRNWD